MGCWPGASWTVGGVDDEPPAPATIDRDEASSARLPREAGLAAHDVWLAAHDAWLAVHESCLAVHDAWLVAVMARGSMVLAKACGKRRCAVDGSSSSSGWAGS